MEIDGQSKSSEDPNETDSCKGKRKGPADELRRLCLKQGDEEYPEGTYVARYGVIFEYPLKDSVFSLMELGLIILRGKYKNPLNMNRNEWFLGNTFQQWLLDIGELARKRLDEKLINQVMDKASELVSRSTVHDYNSYREIVEKCKTLELTTSTDERLFGRNAAKGAQVTEGNQSSEDEEEVEIAGEAQMSEHLAALGHRLAWVEGLTADQKLQQLQHKTLQKDEVKENMKIFFTQMDKYYQKPTEAPRVLVTWMAKQLQTEPGGYFIHQWITYGSESLGLGTLGQKLTPYESVLAVARFLQNPVDRIFRINKAKELKSIPYAFLALLEGGKLLAATKHIMNGRLAKYVITNLVTVEKDGSRVSKEVRELNELKNILPDIYKAPDLELMAAIDFGKAKERLRKLSFYRTQQKGKKTRLQDNNREQTTGENRANVGREGEEHLEKIESERVRKRMQVCYMARRSVKGAQFNTRMSTHRESNRGFKLQWLAETVENKGMGWSLDVTKVGAHIAETAILWNAGDVDITTSPDTFLRWQGETQVQVLWRNGNKDYVMIKEIAWRMGEKGGCDWCSKKWDPKLVDSTEDAEESSDDDSEESEDSSKDESEDGSNGQK